MEDVQRSCTECGHELQSVDHFCPECGHKADEVELEQEPTEVLAPARRNRLPFIIAAVVALGLVLAGAAWWGLSQRREGQGPVPSLWPGSGLDAGRHVRRAVDGGGSAGG